MLPLRKSIKEWESSWMHLYFSSAPRSTPNPARGHFNSILFDPPDSCERCPLITKSLSKWPAELSGSFFYCQTYSCSPVFKPSTLLLCVPQWNFQMSRTDFQVSWRQKDLFSLLILALMIVVFHVIKKNKIKKWAFLHCCRVLLKSELVHFT